MTWKDESHRHIAKVIAANPTITDEKELRKLISAAYPFGERKYFPYKAWCQAVKEVFAHRQAYGVSINCSSADYTDTPLFKS